MNWTRKEKKKQAKITVKSARVNAVLFTLLYLAIALIVSAIDTYVSGGVPTLLEEYGLAVPSWLPNPHFPALLVTFVSVAVWLLNCLLEAGYSLYHLGIYNGKEKGYGTLFDGLAFVGKLVLLNIVMFIFLVLWSLLLIVPGIIASYRYRFAIYNLCENPEIGVMEAIRMSKQQTRGFKWDLFGLDLSFIGWLLLCILTCGILILWVAPWFEQTNVAYFQAIKEVKHIGYFPPEENDGEFHSVAP